MSSLVRVCTVAVILIPNDRLWLTAWFLITQVSGLSSRLGSEMLPVLSRSGLLVYERSTEPNWGIFNAFVGKRICSRIHLQAQLLNIHHSFCYDVDVCSCSAKICPLEVSKFSRTIYKRTQTERRMWTNKSSFDERKSRLKTRSRLNGVLLELEIDNWNLIVLD